DGPCQRERRAADGSQSGGVRSLVAFGTQHGEPVVLKIARRQSDEWNAGAVLGALACARVPRVIAQMPGVVLMERMIPGTPLTEDNDDAIDVVATIVRAFPACAPPAGTPTAEDWGEAFARHPSSDGQIDRELLNAGSAVYRELCATQAQRRLLHGDL